MASASQSDPQGTLELGRRIIGRFVRVRRPATLEEVQAIVKELEGYPKAQRTNALIHQVVRKHVDHTADVLIEADNSDVNDLIDRLIDKFK
jgi:hypothetical protein